MKRRLKTVNYCNNETTYKPTDAITVTIDEIIAVAPLPLHGTPPGIERQKQALVVKLPFL